MFDMVDQIPSDMSSLSDLMGENYHVVLARLHSVLKPRTYFEIGCDTGESLSLARCAAIAVDPSFRFLNLDIVRSIVNRPSLGLYQTTSDRFFVEYDISRILGAPIDMAFLDGMHRCEFLLRDFINTERYCRRNSVVILHDCLPVERAITTRVQGSEPSLRAHRREWWAGDVWRTALLLKRERPDLQITALDASPTGLIIITNLDPRSTKLPDNYANMVTTMLSWNLDGDALRDFHDEMNVEPTSVVASDEQITSRYWL